MREEAGKMRAEINVVQPEKMIHGINELKSW